MKKFENIAKRFGAKISSCESFDESDYCIYEKIDLFPKSKQIIKKKHLGKRESSLSFESQNDVCSLTEKSSKAHSIKGELLPNLQKYDKFLKNQNCSTYKDIRLAKKSERNKTIGALKPSGTCLEKSNSDCNFYSTSSICSGTSKSTNVLLEDDREATFTSSVTGDYEYLSNTKSKFRPKQRKKQKKSFPASHHSVERKPSAVETAQSASACKIIIGGKIKDLISKPKLAKSDSLLTVHSSSSLDHKYKSLAFRPLSLVRQGLKNVNISTVSTESLLDDFSEENLLHFKNSDQASVISVNKKINKDVSYQYQETSSKIWKVSDPDLKRHLGLDRAFNRTGSLTNSQTHAHNSKHCNEFKRTSSLTSMSHVDKNTKIKFEVSEANEAKDLLTKLKKEMNGILSVVQNSKSQNCSSKSYHPTTFFERDSNERTDEFSLAYMKNLLNDLQSTIFNFATEIKSKKTITYGKLSIQNPLNFSLSKAVNLEIIKNLGFASNDAEQPEPRPFKKRHYSIDTRSSGAVTLYHDRDETTSNSSSSFHLNKRYQNRLLDDNCSRSVKEKSKNKKNRNKVPTSCFDPEQKRTESPLPSSRREKRTLSDFSLQNNQQDKSVQTISKTFQPKCHYDDENRKALDLSCKSSLSDTEAADDHEVNFISLSTQSENRSVPSHKKENLSSGPIYTFKKFFDETQQSSIKKTKINETINKKKLNKGFAEKKICIGKFTRNKGSNNNCEVKESKSRQIFLFIYISLLSNIYAYLYG